MDQLPVLSSPARRNLRSVATLEPEGQVIVRLTVPELAGVAVQDSVDFLNHMLNLNAQSTAKAMSMIISNLNTPQATLAIETIQKATESAIQDFEKIGAAAARVAAGFTTPSPTGGVGISIAPDKGDGQTAKAGVPVNIPPSVQVKDTHGNPVTGINVTFLPEEGGGSVEPEKLPTDANGIAAVKSWTLGKEGQNTLMAALDFAGKPSITFTATATAA
jgi:hypothetical protein